ncbi:STAS domain-containing protein [Candidatus Clostridium stratigraminis]|uniref:Anti-sigma factor antagonist n=1 Tax=Candidatus Clostridium stratigraminis TaxID=3381661 RepID=A0ABW8SZE0_9CLOT
MKDKIIVIPENFAVEEAGDLREKLYSMILKGDSNFLLDFSKCTFIDSTGLGVLVSVYKKCAEKNGTVKLRSINQQVMRVFKLTRLDNVFEII